MLSHPKKFPKKHEQIVHYRNKTHSKKELGTKIMKEVDKTFFVITFMCSKSKSCNSFQ